MTTIVRPQSQFPAVNIPIRKPIQPSAQPMIPEGVHSVDTVQLSQKAPLFAGRSRHLKDKQDSKGAIIKGEETLKTEREEEVMALEGVLAGYKEAQKPVGKVFWSSVGEVTSDATEWGVEGSKSLEWWDGGLVMIGSALVGFTGGVITGSVNSIAHLVDRMRKDPSLRKSFQQQLNQKRPESTALTVRVDEAKGILASLYTMKPKAETAVHAIDPLTGKEVFEKDECQALAKAKHTEYEEVDDEYQRVHSLAIKVPGFKTLFQRITGKPLDGGEAAIDAVLQDLRSQDEAIQVLALKRLYPLEGDRPEHSKVQYPAFLQHSNPKVAATALEMMVKESVLRPQEAVFHAALANFLRSGEPVLETVALKSIEQLQMPDPAIDVALKQLAHSKSPLSKNAFALWDMRRQNAIASEQDPEKDARAIAVHLVGNPELAGKLQILLGNYYYAQEHSPNAVTPGMILYLPGKSGIGKTSLVNQLQTVLSGGKRELVHIKPKNIGPNNRLADILRRSTPPNSNGIHDLTGKVLFFDEFQGIDTVESKAEQKKFLEDMKDLFAVDNTDIRATQQWLQKENIRLNNPIMAIASNDPLSDLDAIENLSQGQALLDRLSQVTRSSSANRFTLNSDLKGNIDEFVVQFGPKQYFQNIDNRKFTGPITLTPRAQHEFSSKLKKEVEDGEGRVSGRKLATWMVNDLNTAIDQYAEPADNQFSRVINTDLETGNSKTRIAEPLVFDADHTGQIKLKR
jgi:hypothetical protein